MLIYLPLHFRADKLRFVPDFISKGLSKATTFR